MFTFEMEDLGPQTFDVATAKIGLFRHALTEAGVFSLSVNIFAAEKDVPADDDVYPMAPAFYTEWLKIPDSALVSRDLGCLDGYRMEYDVAREKELGFDQFPGAIQQDSHAGFQMATMSLVHLGAGKYRVQAQGYTEFGWTFAIDHVATFHEVMFRDGWADSKQEPDPRIKAEFDAFFDGDLFDRGWKKQGSADYGWHSYIATPKKDSL